MSDLGARAPSTGETDTPFPAAIDPAVFGRLFSRSTAERIIRKHLSQQPGLVSDASPAALSFDLPGFFALLRDRRWHHDEEIKFYADDRAGPSTDLWSKTIRPNGSLTLDSILHLKANRTSIYVKRLELMVQEMRELAAAISRSGYFTTTLSAMYSPRARARPPTISTLATFSPSSFTARRAGRSTTGRGCSTLCPARPTRDPTNGISPMRRT